MAKVSEQCSRNTPERAVFINGGLEITRKWGKKKRLDTNL
jgi:hypothetical protein